MQDTDSECSEVPDIVRDGLACNPPGGYRRPRPSSDSDDDAESGRRPAQRPRVCPIPVLDAGFYDLDTSCCQSADGYEWAKLKVQSAAYGIMFGIPLPSVEDLVGFCSLANST